MPRTAGSKATLAAGLVALFAVAGATPAAAHPANIVMQEFAIVRGFEPPSLPVKAGSAVSFGNFDATGEQHHPISDDGDPARLSGGGACFDAGVLSLDEIAFVTPSCTGIITYHCEIHPWMRANLRIA